MIKYHGTPITPKLAFDTYMTDRNVLVSYAETRDLGRALKFCNKIIIDNGAFSMWRKQKTVDWDNFYKFLEPLHDRIEFFFIPDVIDGTEIENDKLITKYLYKKHYFKKKALFIKPVFVFAALVKVLLYFFKKDKRIAWKNK